MQNLGQTPREESLVPHDQGSRLTGKDQVPEKERARGLKDRQVQPRHLVAVLAPVKVAAQRTAPRPKKVPG